MHLLEFLFNVLCSATMIVVFQVGSQPFNMHYTDRGERRGGDYDCLSYTVLDDIILQDVPPALQHQSILYCFRPSANLTYDGQRNINVTAFSNNTKFTTMTFKQLQVLNVTADHLLSWSASFDLIERYVAYLRNHYPRECREHDSYFYNCTPQWFGPTCQYMFRFISPFTSIVKAAFDRRLTSTGAHPVSSTTCYTHLDCNYAGSGYACLDWREVCDGKVDCADGGNDEKHCFELELNECKDNEYRCQNGLCIAREFFRDNRFNPECLDRTDEGLETYSKDCALDPSFRCEEHTCKISGRDRAHFACGDGRCLRTDDPCENNRNGLDRNFDGYFRRHGPCWAVMGCVTKFIHPRVKVWYEKWCRDLNSTVAQRIIEQHCPRVFDFPTDFVALGHVRLLYTSNMSKPMSKFILPVYVCYKEELCPFLPPTVRLPTSDNESLTCRHFRELGLENVNQTWLILVGAVQKYFRRCSGIVTSNSCEGNVTSSLFRCPNSTKCISKHRLIDGIVDCAGGEDETYMNSCELGHRDRFKCSNDRRCLAPILIEDGRRDCASDNDEAKELDAREDNQTSFQNMCNGFVEMEPVKIEGREETDETHCEHWNCSNAYTRFDGIWNCPNGLDESRYPPALTCSSLEHLCLHPVTYDFSCLPMNRVNDRQVDCLGGTDERHFCRAKHPRAEYIRFLCMNSSSKCVFVSSLCDDYSDCPYDDDERFCGQNLGQLCSASQIGKRSMAEDYLCQLDERKKPAKRYFALYDFPDYPPMTPETRLPSFQHFDGQPALSIEPISSTLLLDWPSRWRCNRGLNIIVNDDFRCLCPPSYYGDLCQYQNQRVSLTLQLYTMVEIRIPFAVVITLVDNTGLVHSHDQFTYLAIRDCQVKFNFYLLYATRPKDPKKVYSITIDMYEKYSFIHRATWLFPVKFGFLPVHRLAYFLKIPYIPMHPRCSLQCNHGHCRHVENDIRRAVCQCDRGWWGERCERELKCNCSPESKCMGLVNNRSICLCPIDRFGPRCYLIQNACASRPCRNEGHCVPGDVGRRATLEYTCLCNEGYSGIRCEIIDTRIDISFRPNIPIPTSILVHFITIHKHTQPTSVSTFQRIAFNQISAVVYTATPFRLIFVQFDRRLYLAFHSTVQSRLSHISTVIQASHRCSSTKELFNATTLELHALHRIKYYHLPCQRHAQLICFYDHQYLCLCTTDRRADCFEFDPNSTSSCDEENFCKNGAQCFQDDPSCPKTTVCGCRQCFFGSRCQFSTEGSGLSLDVILGYHIEANQTFAAQSPIVFISVATTTFMFVVGLVDAILSILTFQAKKIRQVGCGLYLFATSITSLLVSATFAIKIYLLIISQMGVITRRSFLLGHCIMMDFLVRVFLNVSDWLSACVCVERAMTVHKGINFDAAKSKRTSKFVIGFVYFFVFITAIHEPLHRQLVDDDEEQRVWCVVTYSSWLSVYNYVVVIFHFLVPFLLNIVFSLLIMILAARRRSTVQQHLTALQHFREQFQQHKNLLISPCVLILLAVPRLIMSFTSGCMSSSRQSSFFLAGYFVSFIPPSLVFFVFVLPSEVYKSQFFDSLKNVRNRYRQSFR